MEPIKRYNQQRTGCAAPVMIEHPKGAWAAYQDVKDIVRRVRVAERIIDILNDSDALDPYDYCIALAQAEKEESSGDERG